MSDKNGQELIEDMEGGMPCSRREKAEDMLEQLCRWRQRGWPLPAARLCEEFQLSKREGTYYLKKMLEYGYIYPLTGADEIQLTSFGIARGEELGYRHETFTQFLQLAGVEPEDAEEDACRIEHVVDGNTASRMQIISGAIRHRNDCRALRNYLEEAFEFLGHAEREVGTVLPALPVGKRATVLKLGANIAEPQRLEAQGLTVGATVTVERLLPEVNRCVCRVDGRECDLSLDDAENIWIDPAGS